MTHGSHATGDESGCPDCEQFGRHSVIGYAEFHGRGRTVDGMLQIGTPDENGDGACFVPYREGEAEVFVRRISDDLSVYQIVISRGDGLFQEVLDGQNFEADRYPLGPKEYWRSKMVGEYLIGEYEANASGRESDTVMTDADFERYWAEDEDGDVFWVGGDE